MQPTMTNNVNTDQAADAPMSQDNIEKAIAIVLSSNEKQVRKILDILFM